MKEALATSRKSLGGPRRLAAAAATLGLVWVAGPAHAEDWPQFRGPRRDARSLETGLLVRWPAAGPRLLWTATGLGEGYSQPAVAGGCVYVTGMVDKTGHLFAFDLAGRPKWTRPYGPEWTRSYPGSRNTPTVDQGLVYIMSSLGEVVCMDALTGDERWRVHIAEKFHGGTGQFGFIESLLVDGDRVICTPGGPDALLVALDRNTGDVVWRTAGLDDKAAYCSPLRVEHGGRRLIVTMTSHHIVGVEAATGRLQWQWPCRNPHGQHPNTPSYAAGTLFCTSGDKVGSLMLALSAGGAVALRWCQPMLDCHHGNVVDLGSFVCGSAHQNAKGWVGLDLASGDVLFESQAIAKGSCGYADGMLYCYGVDGSVSLVKPSPAGLDVVSRFAIDAGSGEHFAHPAISGGRLFIRRGDALMVYAIRDDQP